MLNDELGNSVFWLDVEGLRSEIMKDDFNRPCVVWVNYSTTDFDRMFHGKPTTAGDSSVCIRRENCGDSRVDNSYMLGRYSYGVYTI